MSRTTRRSNSSEVLRQVTSYKRQKRLWAQDLASK